MDSKNEEIYSRVLVGKPGRQRVVERTAGRQEGLNEREEMVRYSKR